MYKKLIIKLVLLFLPFACIVLYVNVKVDSGFVINNRSSEIARILLSGKNTAIKYVPSKWGSLQTAVVEEQLKEKTLLPKDILVFGSSRSSEISSELFPQNSFFNCAVPGGNIYDYFALYGLYKRNNLMPKYLFINIDAATFHSRKSITVNNEILYIADTTAPLTVHKDLWNDFKNGVKYLGLKADTSSGTVENNLSYSNIIEMFNPNYFQTNLRSMQGKMVMETTKEEMESYFVIRKDGSFSLNQQSKIDSNKVRNKSQKFIEIQKSKFFISSDTATIYYGYFKQLLFALKKEGVIPIVYFSPVNPVVYDNLSTSVGVPLENSIKNFCIQNGVFAMGSFNPHKYGYNRISNYFFDAYHPVKSVVNNLFHHHAKELKEIGIEVN